MGRLVIVAASGAGGIRGQAVRSGWVFGKPSGCEVLTRRLSGNPAVAVRPAE